MGIIGGLVLLGLLATGTWILAWVVIGVYLGRRWGVNEYVSGALAVVAGPIGIGGVYVWSRRRRHDAAVETSEGADRLAVPDF